MLFNMASLSSSITAPSQPLQVFHNDRQEALKLSKQMARQRCGVMMQTSYVRTFCEYQGISSQLLERDFLHTTLTSLCSARLFFTNRLCLMLNRNVLTEISLIFLFQGLLGSHFLSLGGPENLTVSYPAHGWISKGFSLLHQTLVHKM